jgi:hypothetical protein
VVGFLVEVLVMIVVDVGKQMNGATFRLNHRTETMLASHIPGWAPPSDSLFVAADTQWDFERMHGPTWTQVVMLLTGLNEEQIRNLGGVRFVSPADDDEVVYESLAA